MKRVFRHRLVCKLLARGMYPFSSQIFDFQNVHRYLVAQPNTSVVLTKESMIHSRPISRFSSWRLRNALLTALATLLMLLPLVARASADASVHLIYFYDPECSTCTAVHREVLEPLMASYGEKLVVDERSIADNDGFYLMLTLEQQYHVSGGAIPEIFIGQDALIGPDEVRSHLRERVEHYLAQGGVQAPEFGITQEPMAVSTTVVVTASAPSPQTGTTPTGATAVIHAAFFYQPGCDACERSEHDLKYITDKYPQLQVQRFNVKTEVALNQYLCLRVNVPEDQQLTAPAFFVGNGYLLGDQVRAIPLETLIEPYLPTGAAEPWADWEAHKQEAEETIVGRFRSLGLLTVVGAGLLDGINPCAFATMIFLISYLSVRKRKGRELLATGAAFTVGVFLAYLGVGLGFLRFLASLPILDVLGKWLYAITALLCLGLAWGSFMDYRKAKEGRLEDMSLKLPKRMRGWTHRLIREGSEAQRFMLASFLLGLVVSLIELACTGQVYLPTIVFVLGVPAWRTRGALALVIYNVMFVLPLIGVFLLAYFGTTSQQLLRWMNKRASAVKLGTAVLFLFLAAWLGYSLFASLGVVAGTSGGWSLSTARMEATATAIPTDTPEPTATPEPTPNYRVTIVDPVHKNVDSATIDMKNCGVWKERREKLSADFAVQQSVNVTTQATSMPGDIVMELPEELRANLVAEVQAAYQQTFDAAKAKQAQIELTAGPHTHFQYVILWMEDTYSSTVAFNLNDQTYSVPYTYTLRYPVSGGYRTLGCTA